MSLLPYEVDIPVQDITAFHNSGERYDPPRCHPRTRKAILEKIMSWVRGEIETDAFVFWLNGSVGVGKSAIGQTIAEMCEKEGRLLASFFGRSDPTRNNAKFFVTTLAYQIALAVPHTRRHIEQALEHDRFIHTRSLETQMAKLVVEPLKQAAAEQINIPSFIVVDGLDECKDPYMQCKILDTIHKTSFSLAASGRRLVFLVGSRPEQEISLKFNSISMQGITTHHTIGDSHDANNDIRHFFEYGFEEIKKAHSIKDTIPASWPNPQSIDWLVRRSSGQFLYTHIVLNYICNIWHHPVRRLQEILTLRVEQANNPFVSLDALYTHIFSSLENMDSTLKILGFKLADQFPLDLLSEFVHDALTLSFDDVKLIFGDLSSVIEVSSVTQAVGPGMWSIELQHASLGEFLTDQRRSKEHFVDVEASLAEWVSWILRNDSVTIRVLKRLPDVLGDLQSCKSQVLHDALQDCRLGFLFTNICAMYTDPLIGDNVYVAIKQIRNMAFGDAQTLYELQLRVFESGLPAVLVKYYSNPACIPLLLSNFTVKTPHRTGWALAWILRTWCGKIIRLAYRPDPLSITWRYHGKQEWLSFLSALICDPRKSHQYRTVNSARRADAALAFIDMLCHPVSPTKVFHIFAQLTEPVKNHPWRSCRMQHSRSRTAPGKWFKWHLCDSCGKAHTTPSKSCPGIDQFVPTLAYFTSPQSPIIVLHDRASTEMLVYRFALTFLSDMLATASRSAELMERCRECVFHSTSILFPRKTKIARTAMSKYLEWMEEEERGWWLD
ncbi:hypothetical protein NLJ89_g5923 [Agrocybe chaxingu]|uniref:Nephrocystin 3-like N-terminal domain-containing protein n=1 Tax=Agrocybe chaxingu TaxID=84603 RepID=A0A9W8JZP0_9AGAR|nr:hypothetical protein NLJ89_g5923 [Agrocybe chaxingu]